MLKAGEKNQRRLRQHHRHNVVATDCCLFVSFVSILVAHALHYLGIDIIMHQSHYIMLTTSLESMVLQRRFGSRGS
jgi:hypothetical protein